MLAKQWLANYERTGQTGPLEEQGLRRTEKFNGAERWKLRYVVEALPTLILVSLGLFFVAMVDYVWTINREVTILIAAFSAVGTAFYIAMLLSAAMFSNCPYQTAPSSAIANLANLLRPVLDLTLFLLGSVLTITAGTVLLLGSVSLDIVKSVIRRDHNSTREMVSLLHQCISEMWTFATRPRASTQDTLRDEKDSEPLHADTAQWLLETSPHEDVTLAVACNIPAIQDFRAVRRLAEGNAALSLTTYLHTHLSRRRNRTASASEKSLTVVARALLHILLANPDRHGADAVKYLLSFGDWDLKTIHEWLPSPELKFLWACIIRICARISSPDASQEHFMAWVHVIQRAPFKELLDAGFSSGGTFSPRTAERYIHHFILSDFVSIPRYQNGDQMRPSGDIVLSDFTSTFRTFLSSDLVPSTRSFLSLAVQAIAVAFDHQVEQEPVNMGDRVKEAWTIRSGYASSIASLTSSSQSMHCIAGSNRGCICSCVTTLEASSLDWDSKPPTPLRRSISFTAILNSTEDYRPRKSGEYVGFRSDRGCGSLLFKATKSSLNASVIGVALMLSAT